MFAPIPTRFALFALLALSMAATRFTHGGAPWLPPDASWAVFFLGGFYLTRQWRWALGILLIEAVGVDCLAIQHYGISNYCVTLAYWFLVPAYSALWLGGGMRALRLLRQRRGRRRRDRTGRRGCAVADRPGARPWRRARHQIHRSVPRPRCARFVAGLPRGGRTCAERNRAPLSVCLILPTDQLGAAANLL